MNPANLTRCEVCHYHYQLGQGIKPWRIHTIFYVIAIVQIILFFAIGAALGAIVRATNIVEVVDWGRLSFMKPDTDRGWFFLGVCFECFIIGVASTIFIIVQWLRGRYRRLARHTTQRRSGFGANTTTWTLSARQNRTRSRDCMRDCCHGSDDSCLVYCYLVGPDCYCMPCEACFGSFDAQCTQCCECMNCGDGCTDMPSCDCGGGECGGDNPCMVVVIGCFMAAAVALLFIGMFVMFWTILVNVIYGFWLNQRYVRDVVANRWRIQEYNPKLDDQPQEEFEERDLEGQPDSLAEAAQASAAPAQEVMATTVGRPEKEGYEAPEPSVDNASVDEFPQGELVSIDLTGAFPATRVSRVDD